MITKMFLFKLTMFRLLFKGLHRNYMG